MNVLQFYRGLKENRKGIILGKNLYNKIVDFLSNNKYH